LERVVISSSVPHPLPLLTIDGDGSVGWHIHLQTRTYVLGWFSTYTAIRHSANDRLRLRGDYGLQTMCEGGDMANATISERLA
jgi:hypothetical protein